MLRKILSLTVTSALLLMTNHTLFANIALEEAKGVLSNPARFDGSMNYKATIPLPTLSASPNQQQQQKPEPTFIQKLIKDIKVNKTSYITALGAAGLIGFVLAGPIGAVVGMAALFAFVVNQRANYISNTYKK